MKKNVVFWVGVKNETYAEKYGGWEWMDISRKTWEFWCNKHDVLFVPFEKPVEKDWEDYEYFIWVKDHADIWISILDYDNNCIFVGKPEKLLTKYEEKV